MKELMATACSPALAEGGSRGGAGMQMNIISGYTGNSPPDSCPFFSLKSLLILLFIMLSMSIYAQTKISVNQKDGTSVVYKISDIDSIIFISQPEQKPETYYYTLSSGNDLAKLVADINKNNVKADSSRVTISPPVTIFSDAQVTDLDKFMEFKSNPLVKFTGNLNVNAGKDRLILPESKVMELYKFGGKISQSGSIAFRIPTYGNQISAAQLQTLLSSGYIYTNRSNDFYNILKFRADSVFLTPASTNSDSFSENIASWPKRTDGNDRFLSTGNIALNVITDHRALAQIYSNDLDPFFVSNARKYGNYDDKFNPIIADIKIKDGETLIFKEITGGWGGWIEIREYILQFTAAMQRAFYKNPALIPAGMWDGNVVRMEGGPFDRGPPFRFNDMRQYPESMVKLVNGKFVRMDDPGDGLPMPAITLRSLCIKHIIYIRAKDKYGSTISPEPPTNIFCIVVPDYIKKLLDNASASELYTWNFDMQRFITINSRSTDYGAVPPRVISETEARNLGIIPHDIDVGNTKNKWDNYGRIQLTGNGR